VKAQIPRAKNSSFLTSGKVSEQSGFYGGYDGNVDVIYPKNFYIVYTTNFRHLRHGAFSLVEVVLAISIMSFACLILIGLMADGLQSVHRAITTTVQAQIMQNIVNSAEIQSYNNGSFTNSMGSAPAVFYFDDEGTPIYGTPIGSPPAKYLYSATITSTNFTLPGSAGASSSTPVAQTKSGTEPGVAAVLQVVIVPQNNTNQMTTHTLIWPNTTGQGY